MTVNRYVHGGLTVLVFLGVIWTAQLTGTWSTSGKVDTAGQPIQATGADVEEIKGWMKIEDVAKAYGVPVQEVYATFQIPADTPPGTAFKDLEKISPAFSVSKLREWLAARK
jgi:hypothetical protein